MHGRESWPPPHSSGLGTQISSLQNGRRVPFGPKTHVPPLANWHVSLSSSWSHVACLKASSATSDRNSTAAGVTGATKACKPRLIRSTGGLSWQYMVASVALWTGALANARVRAGSGLRKKTTSSSTTNGA